jgi:2Fe-2S ferredoxin
VYVDEAWFDKLDRKSATEEMLLDAVCDLQPNSRLSCQVEVTEKLEGLVVRMPAKQV